MVQARLAALEQAFEVEQVARLELAARVTAERMRADALAERLTAEGERAKELAASAAAEGKRAEGLEARLERSEQADAPEPAPGRDTQPKLARSQQTVRSLSAQLESAWNQIQVLSASLEQRRRPWWRRLTKR